MDVSYCSPVQLQETPGSFLFDCESLLDKSFDALTYDQTSDPGYFSAGSSLSPTSSVDSFSFSPASIQANDVDVLDCLTFSSPAAPAHKSRSPSTATTKPSRSRYPGKKRQTASEREKLRMRDLTKALHHLRSYLPQSVAPAGHPLTKIETLRLTIRYISYLSAQLGLSDEVLEQRRATECLELPQTINQFLGEPADSCTPQVSGWDTTGTSPLFALQQLHQVSDEVSFNAETYWSPQQPIHQYAPFTGQR